MKTGPDGRVDRDFLVHTASALVRIPSVNPALGREGTGESAIADYTEAVLKALGLDVVRLESHAGRPSVLGVLRGSGGPSLMLNGHYDTVGVAGMEAPFSGEVKDGRLWGRGSYDMKGALAACIAAVKWLSERPTPPPGDVIIAAVADEETESLGIREVLGACRPAHAIVVEPSELGICTAHKGFVWLDVLARGRAAHGSRPDLGVDANLRMAGTLAGLAPYGAALAARRAHPLLGAASAHVGRIEGGEGASTYAAECRARIERRTLPDERADTVVRELEGAIGQLAETRLALARAPFEAHPRSPVVRSLELATADVMGRPAERVGTGPWTDAAFLQEAGADAVVFGPVGGGAHAAREWVDVESLVALARVLTRVPGRLAEAGAG